MVNNASQNSVASQETIKPKVSGDKDSSNS